MVALRSARPERLTATLISNGVAPELAGMPTLPLFAIHFELCSHTAIAGLAALLVSMLSKDPAARPSINDLMKHALFVEPPA